MKQFSIRMIISLFVAMLAFSPATLLAGGGEKKAEGKEISSDEGKKGDKKEKDAKKGAN